MAATSRHDGARRRVDDGVVPAAGRQARQRRCPSMRLIQRLQRGIGKPAPSSEQSFHQMRREHLFTVRIRFIKMRGLQDFQDGAQALEGMTEHDRRLPAVQATCVVRHTVVFPSCSCLRTRRRCTGDCRASSRRCSCNRISSFCRNEAGRSQTCSPMKAYRRFPLRVSCCIGNLAWQGATCARAQGGGRCGLAYRRQIKKPADQEIPAHRPPWNRQDNAFSAVPKGGKQSLSPICLAGCQSRPVLFGTWPRHPARTEVPAYMRKFAEWRNAAAGMTPGVRVNVCRSCPGAMAWGMDWDGEGRNDHMRHVRAAA